MATERETIVWKHKETGKYLVLKPKRGFSIEMEESQSFDIDEAYTGHSVLYEIRSKQNYEPIPVIVKRAVELKVGTK